MADFNPISWWRKILARPNDTLSKTLFVAFSVAFVSAVIVSVTAVTLRPLQEANLLRQRQAQMDAMISRLPGMADLLREVDGDALDVRVVDLNAGTFVFDVDPATYDQRVAANDPEQSIALSAEKDAAGIGRRANYAPVYMLRKGDGLSLLVLPVHGIGYQSTMYGYLALEGNLNTIAGLTFFEQGETPGLGAKIVEPSWEALWPGTQLAGPDGKIWVEVVRGEAREPYQVDGISGATRTGNGVTNLLRFWLGEDGFGPFLGLLRSGEV